MKFKNCFKEKLIFCLLLLKVLYFSDNISDLYSNSFREEFISKDVVICEFYINISIWKK